MPSNKLQTREKIILATIDCVGRDGIQSLTIRSISKEAGVNSAAINYYFGTKEKLVDEAMNQTLDEMSGLTEEILSLENIELRVRLQKFLEAIIEGIVNYPGITVAHLYTPLIKNNYKGIFVRRFNAFLQDILSKIEKDKAKDKEMELKITIVQLISSIVLPALMPRIFHSFVNINFKDPKTRRAYVAHLLDHFFNTP